MGDSDGISRDRRSAEVIRLRLDGASTTVNTLRDQQTGRGISLVCPFPSLEVDLPVSYGANGKDGMQRGAIHRIGVEDDPDTGLPRLRLSIRKLDEAPITPDPQPVSSAMYENEPAWVNSFEVPMPEEFAERVKTRRRYKMINRTVWIIVLAAIVGGGFALHRSGYFTIEQARSYIAGFSMNDLFGTGEQEQIASIAPEKLEAAEPAAPSPEEIIDDVLEPSDDTVVAAADEARTETDPQEAAQTAVAEVESEKPAETETAEQIQKEPDETEKAVAKSSELAKDEVQLLLPTRWPVEYASGYRMRDPNGVVVDVPGGLVKHEGWLDLEGVTDNPMVRSIKSIQRETGARFIVRINGDLPRFMTAPKTEGVFLTLYYTEASDFGPSEKVALAE